MTLAAEQRLAALAIDLPAPPTGAGRFVATTVTGDLLFTSGQIAIGDGGLVATGRVGDTVGMDTAIACARQCALNLLAQLRDGAGTLDRIHRVVKLTVFVASAPGFIEQHLVANGASDLIADVLGEHCRSAVGVSALPLDSPVEIEAIVELAAA